MLTMLGVVSASVLYALSKICPVAKKSSIWGVVERL